MFKALHTGDNRAIIILDAVWEDVANLNELRSLDRQDVLVCQECRQPVRVRAGADRQWHFAHKQRQNCTYETDTPALLRARAVLYRCLVEKFGSADVELEKKIAALRLPRAIDCWMQGANGGIAFWIMDAGMKVQARETLQEQVSQATASVQWLFTSSMLREQAEPGRVTLTTTERAFMFSSRYDAVYAQLRREQGRTLHYLDGPSATLMTMRGLHQVHAPHTFAGYKITSPLRDVQILGQSGGFVHPGEHDLWEAWRADLKAAAAASDEPGAAALPALVPSSSFPASAGSSLRRRLLASWGADTTSVPGMKPGTCIFCGQETTDYWLYDGKTRTCRCKPCRAKGNE